MKKEVLTEEFKRMQELAGITNENDEQDEFDYAPDWDELDLRVETDHQGEWVAFIDPEDEDPFEDGVSFAVMKRDIENVANGKEINVNDGSNAVLRMTRKDAKKILNRI